MKIVLATRNLHKVREIQEIFSGLPVTFISVSEFKNAPEVVEDGMSFEENAIKKALAISQFTNQFALADDSGIEVDFLNAKPGIHSARFAGDTATDDENNKKLLQLLENIPWNKRSARYRCVMALASPDSRVQTAEGTCEGMIALKPEGQNGFGYDPLFYYPPLGKTLGLVDAEVKNKFSHRYHALEGIKLFIEKISSLCM